MKETNIPHVMINGHTFPVSQSRHLTYEELVRMAAMTGSPSMTFARGPSSRPEGILAPGQKIEICDGMIFSVVHTGNA